VDALDLAVEDGLRVHHEPGRRPEPVRELPFCRALGLAEVVEEAGVVGQRCQAPELAEVGIQPSPMASVMVPASAGLASRSQRRGVTPLVLLLKRSGNISARSRTVTVRRSSE
jgi:hypothetical protein